MPLNNTSKANKAAVKRRQRARIKAGEMTEIEKQRSTDLLQGIIDIGDPKPTAIARLVKRNMGAPTVLRPAIASRIVKYMTEGNYLNTSCRAVGVSSATFILWRKKAEAAMEFAEAEYTKSTEAAWNKLWAAEAEIKSAEADGSFDDESIAELKTELETRRQAIEKLALFEFVPEDAKIHVHLVKSVEMADARGELELLKKASKGARGWQASMAILERRYRDGWGKKSEIDHKITGDEDRPVVIKYESDDSERAKRVAAILQTSNAIEGHATEVTDELEEQFEKESEGVEAID